MVFLKVLQQEALAVSLFFTQLVSVLGDICKLKCRDPLLHFFTFRVRAYHELRDKLFLEVMQLSFEWFSDCCRKKASVDLLIVH